MSFKVYFEYGTMGSSKSSQLLMIANNYRHKGVPTYLIKPAIDNRDSEDEIVSRVGLKHKVTHVYKGPSIEQDIGMMETVQDAIDHDGVVFIDEAQFLPYKDVRDLYSETLKLTKGIKCENFCIMAFGLLTDFNDRLFDGTRGWIEVADSLREIKNICAYCNSKATRNLLLNKPDNLSGNILVGDSQYLPVCSRHYNAL